MNRILVTTLQIFLFCAAIALCIGGLFTVTHTNSEDKCYGDDDGLCSTSSHCLAPGLCKQTATACCSWQDTEEACHQASCHWRGTQLGIYNIVGVILMVLGLLGCLGCCWWNCKEEKKHAGTKMKGDARDPNKYVALDDIL